MPAVASLAAAALFLLLPVAGAAHEGGPRLLLEPNEVNPGGTVLIRGEDLGLDEPMDLRLAGDTGSVDVAAVTTDGEGHFVIAVEVPAYVPVGMYAFETTMSTGATIRSLVKVHGVPVQQDQQGAPPGQDEGLPGPGETPAVSSVAVAAPVATTIPVPSSGSALQPLSDPTGTAGDPVPFIALAGAIGALAFLVWRTRRSSAVPTGSGDLS